MFDIAYFAQVLPLVIGTLPWIMVLDASEDLGMVDLFPVAKEFRSQLKKRKTEVVQS